MRTRAALRAGKPVADMIPNWLARRSTASRSSSPTIPAAAATRKKLIERKITPKSVVPFAVASACARTG